ncbi:MAG: sodium:proton antiporter [Bacteroidaceae bacterium]|nr:sodium:proton antiporter [Bacteroidaceae bacterium]
MLTHILMVMMGLLIGVVVKALGKYNPLPYTVTLFAIGIAIGLCSQVELFGEDTYFNKGVDMVFSMDPDFILYVFLPILVFDAAYEMDLTTFNKTFFNSTLLAGPGLVICMLLTACLVMGLLHLSGEYNSDMWIFALMFGGLISATDPVAVVALLQELGTSKKFSTLVDGESLLNDASGLVCFMMFYSHFIAKGGVGNPVIYFGWVILASFIIGYIVYRLTLKSVKLLKVEMLQICVVVVAAYATFMIAQSLLEVSGVIALVVFGHYFAQSGRPSLSESTNKDMEKFWSLLAYVANTLIFLMVGILIATKVDLTWTRVLYAVLVYVGLNIIRFIMIGLLYPILKRKGYGLSLHEAIVLGWGGLRGALSMSMALMVSYNMDIPQHPRDSILIYTAGVITLTLCINATTSKWLVKKLQMGQAPEKQKAC